MIHFFEVFSIIKDTRKYPFSKTICIRIHYIEDVFQETTEKIDTK